MKSTSWRLEFQAGWHGKGKRYHPPSPLHMFTCSGTLGIELGSCSVCRHRVQNSMVAVLHAPLWVGSSCGMLEVGCVKVLFVFEGCPVVVGPLPVR